MRNEFSQETRFLFVDNYECWNCGRNQIDALHHILGRESNSPFNAAPIENFSCHIGQSFSQEKTIKFLVKTYRYLIRHGYKPNQKDKEFLNKHKDLYNKGGIEI